jgi:hypothetical protein
MAHSSLADQDRADLSIKAMAVQQVQILRETVRMGIFPLCGLGQFWPTLVQI